MKKNSRRKKKSRSKGPELLGIHGLVFSSADPNALAERWSELTGSTPLRRSRRDIVLGGPELFVTVRRSKKGSADSLEEVHMAVEEIGPTRKAAREDALGGDSWSRRVGEFVLVVRQFRRPPSRSWRRPRKPV